MKSLIRDLLLFFAMILAVAVLSLAQAPQPPQLTQERILAQYGLAVARLDLCSEHVGALTARIEALQKELDELKKQEPKK